MNIYRVIWFQAFRIILSIKDTAELEKILITDNAFFFKASRIRTILIPSYQWSTIRIQGKIFIDQKKKKIFLDLFSQEDSRKTVYKVEFIYTYYSISESLFEFFQYSNTTKTKWIIIIIYLRKKIDDTILIIIFKTPYIYRIQIFTRKISVRLLTRDLKRILKLKN